MGRIEEQSKILTLRYYVAVRPVWYLYTVMGCHTSY